MTIENTEIQLTATDEFAIQTTTNELIRKAAAKNGMTFEDVPVEAREDAYRFAKAAFQEEKLVKANPLWEQLQAERAAHKLTQTQLDAVKFGRVNVGNDGQPAITEQIARARLGEAAWMGMTNEGRLQAIGVNPASVTANTKQECQELFGRKSSSAHASNYMKLNGKRYRELREIARVMHWDAE